MSHNFGPMFRPTLWVSVHHPLTRIFPLESNCTHYRSTNKVVPFPLFRHTQLVGIHHPYSPSSLWSCPPTESPTGFTLSNIYAYPINEYSPSFPRILPLVIPTNGASTRPSSVHYLGLPIAWVFTILILHPLPSHTHQTKYPPGLFLSSIKACPKSVHSLSLLSILPLVISHKTFLFTIFWPTQWVSVHHPYPHPPTCHTHQRRIHQTFFCPRVRPTNECHPEVEHINDDDNDVLQ